MMIDIRKLLTEDTNIIEIYVLKKNIDNMDLKTDISRDDVYLDNIRKRFKLTRKTTLVYYMRNNMTYVYDLSNDSQYVFIRKLENMDTNVKGLYMIAYNEMKLQPYTFSCTNDIHKRIEYHIEEFKINNRISIVIKNKNVYIHYRHSKEVDIDKIQEIMNHILKKL
jgi:hypothetical protein